MSIIHIAFFSTNIMMLITDISLCQEFFSPFPITILALLGKTNQVKRLTNIQSLRIWQSVCLVGTDYPSMILVQKERTQPPPHLCLRERLCVCVSVCACCSDLGLDTFAAVASYHWPMSSALCFHFPFIFLLCSG